MALTKSSLKSSFGNKTDNVDTFTAALWDNVLNGIDNGINSIIDYLSPTVTDKLYVNGTETSATNGVVTLATGGTYVLSGSLTGRIVVGASTDSPTDDTHIVLKGVKITNSSTDNTAISYLPSAQSLQVTLAKNTTNVLVCSNVAEIAEQQGATLFSENNMILQGNGYLVIQNKGGHGIKASELRISGIPHVYVDANHDGIHGNSMLSIHGGVFYVTNANDAFGTGSTGVINVFGGDFYAYNIAQKVFDAKDSGHFFKDFAIHTDCSYANIYNNMGRVTPEIYFGNAIPDTTNGGFSVEPSCIITLYDDESMTNGNVVLFQINQEEVTIDKPYAKIEGYTELKIKVTVQSANIELCNAYIKNDIVYTPTKKKLQINVEKDKIGIVNGNVISGSNLAIEVKGGGFCSVNGIQGDELTFNDSKGVLVVDGDVTGKDIYFGTQASADATKFLQGAVIINGTLSAILNSKFNKGWVHVLNSNLTGIVYANTVSTKGYADLNGSDHVFYHKAIGAVIGSKTIEDKDYATL